MMTRRWMTLPLWAALLMRANSRVMYEHSQLAMPQMLAVIMLADFVNRFSFVVRIRDNF